MHYPEQKAAEFEERKARMLEDIPPLPPTLKDRLEVKTEEEEKKEAVDAALEEERRKQNVYKWRKRLLGATEETGEVQIELGMQRTYDGLTEEEKEYYDVPTVPRPLARVLRSLVKLGVIDDSRDAGISKKTRSSFLIISNVDSINQGIQGHSLVLKKKKKKKKKIFFFA